MVEPHKDLVVQGEWLVARTLPSILKGKVLVQLINLETSLIRLPNHTSITDLHVMPWYCISEAQPGSNNLPGLTTIKNTAGIADYSFLGLSSTTAATEDYGCMQGNKPPNSYGDASPNRERYRRIPPALHQEVKDCYRVG